MTEAAAGAVTEAGVVACAFVLDAVRSAGGARWNQGRRPRPLACASDDPAARAVAEFRLLGVAEAASRALVAWASGERPADLLRDVPAAADVLARQARGRRCVSLLAAGRVVAPHADALAFAVHDLCHLEKFADPEHYVGQVGFFRLVERAFCSPAWAEVEATLDGAWRRQRDAVVADMNGSSAFLFASLTMRLKMAARRRLARETGRPAPVAGPLDAAERAAFEGALRALVGAFGWRGDLADAAGRVTARRGDVRAARAVVERFEAEGRRALAR